MIKKLFKILSGISILFMVGFFPAILASKNALVLTFGESYLICYGVCGVFWMIIVNIINKNQKKEITFQEFEELMLENVSHKFDIPIDILKKQL